MRIRIKNTSNNPLPQYQTQDSAGMDLRAFLPAGPIVLQPNHRILIGTGLFMELPQGFEAQIRPRSGLALKHGVTVLNSPGTVDADYRGEIKVLLVNLSDQDFEIQTGERIAQLVIARYAKLEDWDLVEELSETERGSGGYGSTGKG